MTPKEKAKELYNKYAALCPSADYCKTQCIIAVDEVIASNIDVYVEVHDYKIIGSNLIGGKPFWLEVREEIAAL